MPYSVGKIPIMKNLIFLLSSIFILACEVHAPEMEISSNIELMKTMVTDTIIAKNDTLGGLEWFRLYNNKYFEDKGLFERLYAFPTLTSSSEYKELEEKCKYGGTPELNFGTPKTLTKESVIPVSISWKWEGRCVSKGLKILEEKYYFSFNTTPSLPLINAIYYRAQCPSKTPNQEHCNIIFSQDALNRQLIIKVK